MCVVMMQMCRVRIHCNNQSFESVFRMCAQRNIKPSTTAGGLHPDCDPKWRVTWMCGLCDRGVVSIGSRECLNSHGFSSHMLWSYVMPCMRDCDWSSYLIVTAHFLLLDTNDFWPAACTACMQVATTSYCQFVWGAERWCFTGIKLQLCVLGPDKTAHISRTAAQGPEREKGSWFKSDWSACFRDLPVHVGSDVL